MTTDDNGNWSRGGFITGSTYKVLPSKTEREKDGTPKPGTWSFNPSNREVVGATRDFKIVGTWKPKWTEESVGPWRVSYVDSRERSGTITVPGATKVKVYFSDIRTEPGADNLTTNSAAPNKWRDADRSGFSGEKTGDNVTVRQLSDAPATGYFIVTKVAYLGTKTGPIAKSGPLWSSTMTSWIIVSSRCVFGSSNGMRQFSARSTTKSAAP